MKVLEGRKWVASAFGLSALLLALSTAISYSNSIQLIESSRKVEQTHAILKNLVHISAALSDEGAGRRGYLLLGDQTELKRYEQSLLSLKRHLEVLQQQIAIQPGQEKQLLKLRSLIAQRSLLSRRSIDLYRAGGAEIEVQLPILKKLNQNRIEINAILEEIQIQEENLLQASVSQAQRRTHSRLIIEWLGAGLSFTILLGVFSLLYDQMIKRQQAETAKQTLAQEKHLSELKLRFFSMVSHEFRTPLSIILGSAQILTEAQHSGQEEKQRKNLHRIQTAARSLNQMLVDILMLTRAEAGKVEFHPTLIDLEAFCLNLTEDMRFSTTPPRTIQFASQGQCSHAHLDEKLLYSILSNLLSNALKYSSTGPVRFDLNCEPDTVVFRVQDQGIGIDLKELDKLYDPFSRGSNVGRRGGSGLGLAVVKKCLDIHGGSISVTSETGRGTTFTVQIPHQSIP